MQGCDKPRLVATKTETHIQPRFVARGNVHRRYLRWMALLLPGGCSAGFGATRVSTMAVLWRVMCAPRRLCQTVCARLEQPVSLLGGIELNLPISCTVDARRSSSALLRQSTARVAGDVEHCS